MITDKDYIEYSNELYPNEDWDKVPDEKDVPDVYVVQGQQHKTTWMRGMQPSRYLYTRESFEVAKEYDSIEEAQAQLEKCKTWHDVVNDTLKIVTRKCYNGLEKALMKEIRKAHGI